MSLTRPILLTTPSFDAAYEKTFTFTVQSGGTRIVANQLTIRSQRNNAIVYQNIQNTFKYQHTLPANTLTNGEYYNATIIVIDAQGNQSLPSSAIQFRCYTTPEIRFTNIPDTGIINSASYNFSFEYTQRENERLNSYVVNLYNASQNLVSTSDVIYVQNGMPPYTASYLFSGFEDNSSYYIEVDGETINGAKVVSPRANFNVKYIKPNLFTLVSLKNNCKDGYITVKSNVVLIDGWSNPDPPIYINGTEIDVTGDDSFVGWKEGYVIPDDFLARGWFRKPNDYSTIAQFSNLAGQTIKLVFKKGYENVDSENLQAYLALYVKSIDGVEYYNFSNYIDILPDSEYYNFQLRRVGNIYQVQLIKM